MFLECRAGLLTRRPSDAGRSLRAWRSSGARASRFLCVVVRPAQVLVGLRLRQLLWFNERDPVEPLRKDRLDRAVRRRAARKRPATRGTDAIVAVASGERHEPEAGPVGVLGVRSGF